MPEAGHMTGNDRLRYRLDKITASHVDSVANMISGLDLSEIGEDGHAVASLLWKITAYLRERNAGESVDELTTTQRTYETGKRYGWLDAKAGRLDLCSGPDYSALHVPSDDRNSYQKGWQEGYSEYLAPLRTEGTRVAVPSLVPGKLTAAVTTGGLHADLSAGRLLVEITHKGGTTWVPVAKVIVKESGDA